MVIVISASQFEISHPLPNTHIIPHTSRPKPRDFVAQELGTKDLLIGVDQSDQLPAFPFAL